MNELPQDFIPHFELALTMHHKIDSSPVKDIKFEKILTAIFSELDLSYEYKSNSHKSGVDIKLPNMAISCKSIKDSLKKEFCISSYRLSACNKKKDFIDEIKKRDETFNYYFILTRKESRSEDCRILFLDYL